jgi:hypothetical protein
MVGASLGLKRVRPGYSPAAWARVRIEDSEYGVAARESCASSGPAGQVKISESAVVYRSSLHWQFGPSDF